MKLAVFCAAAAGVAVLLGSTVDAHGQMLVPTYRPITEKYREDCLYGLTGASDNELQISPIETLAQRGQADQPAAETFDIWNGCRGCIYETVENNVTEIEAGVEFDVEYIIHAPHPGYMELSIVKPSTDSTGTITYNQDTLLEYFSDFGTTAGTYTVTATIPTNVTGCENAGDCALQFYWYSATANQTYPTCADITIPGSGSGSGSSTTATTTTTSSIASSTGSSEADETTATTTDAPTTTTATPTATTAAPTATTATPTATSSEASTAADAEYDEDASDANDEDEDESSAASEDTSSEEEEDASTASDEEDASTASDEEDEESSAASVEENEESSASSTTSATTTTTTTTTDAPSATTASPTTTTATTTSDSDKCSVRRGRRARQ